MDHLVVIDPLGHFGLSPKFRKALEQGKVAAIRLTFELGETRAEALSNGPEGDWSSLVEAMASISATAERPFEDERAHVVGKFEVRLDKEAPAGLRSAADKAALTAAIDSLPFRERRALAMSNREFDLSYLRWENGAPVPRPAAEADKLRQEQIAARGGGKTGRGRGRGGRGRGSFLAPQDAAVSGPSGQQGGGSGPHRVSKETTSTF
jgi:hypothetical protein